LYKIFASLFKLALCSVTQAIGKLASDNRNLYKEGEKIGF